MKILKWLSCFFGRHRWAFITANPIGERPLTVDGNYGHYPATSAFLRCTRCDYAVFRVVPGTWIGVIEEKKKVDAEMEALRKMTGL